MSYAAANLIQTLAPYALLAIAVLCVAATLWHERARQRAAAKACKNHPFGLPVSGGRPLVEESPLRFTGRAPLLPGDALRPVTFGPVSHPSREAGPFFLKPKARKA